MAKCTGARPSVTAKPSSTDEIDIARRRSLRGTCQRRQSLTEAGRMAETRSNPSLAPSAARPRRLGATRPEYQIGRVIGDQLARLPRYFA